MTIRCNESFISYIVRHEIAFLSKCLDFFKPKPKPVHPAVSNIQAALAYQKQKARMRAGKGNQK
jgi:hypothetical protein